MMICRVYVDMYFQLNRNQPRQPADESERSASAGQSTPVWDDKATRTSFYVYLWNGSLNGWSLNGKTVPELNESDPPPWHTYHGTLAAA